MDWFTVDKEGLGKLLERKGKAFAVYELIQNAWDTDAREIRVTLEPLPNKPFCSLVVEDDDPDGFKELSHAFTLFAESEKKSDPTKRGRFNLGEKLVLALCKRAEVASTTGTIVFDESGRRSSKVTLSRGSRFSGEIRMNRSEHQEVCRAVKALIPPAGRKTYFNGEEFAERIQKEAFATKLPTEISDEEGILRKTVRSTLVTLYEVWEGETAHLYELGIPVVELSGGEKWHVNVHQKIPLNSDRDNVTPSYLRDLRTEILNHMHMFIEGEEEASRIWVVDAMSDEKASKAAVEKAKVEAFGVDTVSFDPSDMQANKAAAAAGFTVIPGGSLPKGAWANIRAHGIVQPAGRVFPTDPETKADTEVIPVSSWSLEMKSTADFAKRLANALLDTSITVRMISSPGASTLATWKSRTLTFNVPRLGTAWFQSSNRKDKLSLILHEFGHHFESDHLSEKYYNALTGLGAALALEVEKNPSILLE